jgi:ribonuclease T1
VFFSGFAAAHKASGDNSFSSDGALKVASDAAYPLRRGVIVVAMVAAMASALVLSSASAFAKSSASADDGLATVPLKSLPAEAQTTQRLIDAGGPFPYSKDGTVFGNRERLLPRRPRGQYHEYTVVTPGSKNRGARRIVCAGEKKSSPEACYYTADHYNSFRRIER